MPRKRSSYSQTVACQFKNVFDDAIVDNKDKLLQVPLGKSTDGFRQKCTDALLFLMKEMDTEHEDYKGRKHLAGSYASLRGRVKIKYQEPDKVHIAFVTNNIHLETRTIESESLTAWKQQIQDYLVDEHSTGKPLILRSLFLSVEEQNYAKSLFTKFIELTGKNVVYDIGPTEVYAMKMNN